MWYCWDSPVSPKSVMHKALSDGISLDASCTSSPESSASTCALDVEGIGTKRHAIGINHVVSELHWC